MSEVRQRNVGLTWTVPVSIVLLVVVAVLVVPQVPGRYSLGRFVVLVPFLVFFLYGGLQPLLWWWGADLRVDDRGIGFGTERARTKPAQVTFSARNPYLVPWAGLHGARLVRSGSAVRRMRRAARAVGGPPQPTRFLGYLPATGRAALVLDVDLDQLVVPEVRAPSQRRRVTVGESGAAMRRSSVWAFPVRHVDAVVDALRERGVSVTESAVPQPPVEPSSGRSVPTTEEPPR
ncbi:MAG: hypothetical protein ABI776_05475 [Nocardioidaceae bacterium]